jgi:hypothetical protein
LNQTRRRERRSTAAAWRTKNLSCRRIDDSASGAELLLLRAWRRLRRLPDLLELYPGHAWRSISAAMFRIGVGGRRVGDWELWIRIFRVVEAGGGVSVMAAVLY